ncbi:lactate racemase domain-containing protein [Halorubellus sp. PRR65]|uniref:lactate racemase domain-containing protein n=1 Tax=Halorubellus sp. PRR65 TaxID=3098148 RepID=UPI002B25A957|nr:lactate racemase domain-containing protein [Halorubellus sp. PRR65]
MDLPLGDGTVSVSFDAVDATVARAPGGSGVDVPAASQDALADPHGPRLSERANANDDVAIVVTDGTRAVPTDVLLDGLLGELDAAGVDRDRVTVVVGLGLHRPMTDDELEATLGEHAALARNHDPEDVVAVGEVDGVPIELGRVVADADLVAATGVVEPHQYAGFSGGAKTVVVGAGGESQIGYTHGPDLLARDGVRLGRVENNPFRGFLDRAGDLAGPDFCVNVTKGPQGVLGVAAGDPRAVVRDLAATARNALSVPIADDETYDAVVAGVGAPKDANLYQATRAATYVALGDRNPLVRPEADASVRADSRGRIVVPAGLPEGAGDGTGERRFHEWLSNATDADALYEEMKQGYEPGAQRAFVVARVLRDHDVHVTNSEHPDVVDDCLMHAAETVEDALDPGSDVLVVPDALNTLLVRER